MTYDRKAAVQYALAYALNPNPSYIYFEGNDCSNFISQCLRAGGAKNDFNKTHPWWYYGGKASICWSVAASLYWYIRTRSVRNAFGIKAKTFYLTDYDSYSRKIQGKIMLGDLIQYRNTKGIIQHSAIITDFDRKGEPLISQHTVNGKNLIWRKHFPEIIFHHITGIN